MKKLEIINKKRIISFLFIAMLMITIMGTVVQAAGNYKDADIFIHYSGDGGDVGTKEREKKDYTSSYVYNTKSEYDFFVNVYGTQKADGTRAFKNCSINQFKLHDEQVLGTSEDDHTSPSSGHARLLSDGTDLAGTDARPVQILTYRVFRGCAVLSGQPEPQYS